MTAEFVAVLPAVLLVLSCCLGAVQLVGQQVRLTDAAAGAARSLARGDGEVAVRAGITRSVGRVTFARKQDGDVVCVHLREHAAFGPADLLGVLVEAHGCALAGGR